ncbi:conserved hypothetical protein [Neospora caninum Liverpool]|uniref:Uncharacterized protein n=1 Tax=Neospora caninum (strain Liverpool) TaxID=572307 RepID=F0VG94_NEOCL|nr:conserved hypothetical protein [Neospora caninum Liverpool]CBZ52738.1 conserved hypothetical protein [Neospora caninum Liverpool]CEL66719.1 TPA: hypothetical protein BN1204_025260 [Neospora caninum Liverpool]|eukprot:XP_003882770.1 conserved hypothetical protein [Neospora caninum Liverpool]
MGQRSSVAGSGVHTAETGSEGPREREGEETRRLQPPLCRPQPQRNRGKFDSSSRPRSLSLSDGERRSRRSRVSSSRRSSGVAFHRLLRSPPFPFLPCCGTLPSFVCEACLKHTEEKRKAIPQASGLSSPRRRQRSARAFETPDTRKEGEIKDRRRQQIASAAGENWSLLGDASRRAGDEAGSRRSPRAKICRSPRVTPEWEEIAEAARETGSRRGSEGRKHSVDRGSGDRRARDRRPEESETDASVSSSRDGSREVEQLKKRKDDEKSSQKYPERGGILNENRSVSREICGGREARTPDITSSSTVSSHPIYSSSVTRRPETSVTVCSADFSPNLAPREGRQPYSSGQWCSACGVFWPLVEAPSSAQRSAPSVHTPQSVTRAVSTASRNPLKSAVANFEAVEQEISRSGASGRDPSEWNEGQRPVMAEKRQKDARSHRTAHEPADQHATRRDPQSQETETGNFPRAMHQSPSSCRTVNSSTKTRSSSTRVLSPGDDTTGYRSSSVHVTSGSTYTSCSALLEQSELFSSRQFVHLVSEVAEGAPARVLQVPHIPPGVVGFPPFLTQAQRWTILERLFACRDTDLAAVAPPFALARSQHLLHASEEHVASEKREKSQEALPVEPTKVWDLSRCPPAEACRLERHSLQEAEEPTRESIEDSIRTGASAWADAKRQLLRLELEHDKNTVRGAAGAARCHAAAPSYECKYAHFRHFIDPPAQSSSVASAVSAALAAFQQRTPGHRELLAKFEDRFFDCIFDVYLQLPRPLAHAVWTHLFPFHHPTNHTLQRIQLLLVKVHRDLRKRTPTTGTSPGTEPFPASGAEKMVQRTNRPSQEPSASPFRSAESRTSRGKDGVTQGESRNFRAARRHREGSTYGDTETTPARNRLGEHCFKEGKLCHGAGEKRGTTGGGARAKAEKNALICLLRAASDAQARLLLTRRCRSVVQDDMAT